MTEEITVSLKDMETFLEPEEYQRFLKAKEGVDEYNKQEAEYEKKKADAERLSDEYRKKMSEAENTLERDAWYSKLITVKTFFTAPYFPIHYFQKHDHYLDLVRERKLKHLAEEELKERRLVALEEIDPPFADAEKYLTPEEQQKFVDSLPGAADAYLGRDKRVDRYSPRIWLLNSRAWDYSYWTSVIEDRRKEEIRRKQAQLEHDQYLDRLSLAVEKFQGELAKSKKPVFVYPPDLEKHEPDGWCDLNLPSKQRIQNWAEGKILERLPQILANLTKWELTWQVRVLPNATYEVAGGVACLTWYFESHILVTVNLELKKCVIRERRLGYTVEVQAEGEKLGTLYLGPHNWVTPGSFTTPLPLVCMLAKGQLEAPGITVTDRSPPFTTFAVQGFEEVEVCDDFRRFIRDICKEQPLAQALLAQGIIDEDTSKLVEGKAKLPLPQLVGAQASAGQSTVDNSNVKTALEGMGFKTAEIKAGMEAAELYPGMSLEEKVKAVLKNIGA